MDSRLFIRLLSLIVLFTVAACNRQDILPESHLLIRFNNTKTVQINDVEITFKSLDEDSRCPTNAYCIWEGQAIVALNFNNNWEESLTLRAGDDSSQKLMYEGYEYTLIDVLPHPDANKRVKDKDYEIIIKVEKP